MAAEPVAVDGIARDAGVSRSTVYAIFGSRSGLFEAVGRELAERSGYADRLAAKEESDARDHLRAGMRACFAMFAANREIYRALHSMAQLDEDAVGGAVAAEEAERRRGMARVVGRLAEQGALRTDLSSEKAGQALWVLTSFESFDLLVTGYGLSADEASELLLAIAERTLHTDPG